jgi:protein-tyrosine phosphatase
MTLSHKRAVVQRHPGAVDKTFTLREYAGDDSSAALQAQEELVADIELKRALGQTIPADDYAKLRELQRLMPETDIADPFGGPLSAYEAAAAEIEEHLRKLVAKIRRQGG